MSSPSSWSAPAGQPVPGLQPAPGTYAAPQPYGQPAGQGPGYPGVPAPVGYGGGLPVPQQPPKPERPLRPAVMWALLYNAVQAVLAGVVLALFMSFIYAMVSGFGGADEAEGLGGPFLLWGLALVAAYLVIGWGLTVLALVLWRLNRGFRTLHPAVQALLALLTTWVVSTVLGALLQGLGVFAQLFGAGTAVNY